MEISDKNLHKLRPDFQYDNTNKYHQQIIIITSPTHQYSKYTSTSPILCLKHTFFT